MYREASANVLLDGRQLLGRKQKYFERCLNVEIFERDLVVFAQADSTAVVIRREQYWVVSSTPEA